MPFFCRYQQGDLHRDRATLRTCVIVRIAGPDGSRLHAPRMLPLANLTFRYHLRPFVFLLPVHLTGQSRTGTKRSRMEGSTPGAVVETGRRWRSYLQQRKYSNCTNDVIGRQHCMFTSTVAVLRVLRVYFVVEEIVLFLLSGGIIWNLPVKHPTTPLHCRIDPMRLLYAKLYRPVTAVFRKVHRFPQLLSRAVPHRCTGSVCLGSAFLPYPVVWMRAFACNVVYRLEVDGVC